eukprot:Filipodium_phascolosomae@DN2102_c0_g1_i2.p2
MLQRASSFVGSRGAKGYQPSSSGMPSLSISRAIGDHQAEKMGLSHEPAIKMVGLQSEEMPYCLILASDGVWTPISSKESISLVVSFGIERFQDAANTLTTTAWKRWRTSIKRNGYVDDITSVVAYLQ